jgi:hypothetical protein
VNLKEFLALHPRPWKTVASPGQLRKMLVLDAIGARVKPGPIKESEAVLIAGVANLIHAIDEASPAFAHLGCNQHVGRLWQESGAAGYQLSVALGIEP